MTKRSSFLVLLLIPALLMTQSLGFSHAHADTQPALELVSIKLQDFSATEQKQPVINENLFFVASFRNTLDTNSTYLNIVDIRDADGYTISLMIKQGFAEKHSLSVVRSTWLPKDAGKYTVQAFAISSLENPSVLTPIISKQFNVLAIRPAVILPEQKQEPTPIQSEPSNQTTISSSEDPKKSISIEELRQHALELINKDRAKFGVPTVALSGNSAAQVHADDILHARVLSHWMTNGEKPYMTYSRLGGAGDVSQNLAARPITKSPSEELDELEHSLVYDDYECCENGHRDNIIDKYHTHVSIGIAFDAKAIVLVQNFENIYLTRPDGDTKPSVIYANDKLLTIYAKITAGQIKERPIGTKTFGDAVYDSFSSPIRIYRDPLPTEHEYNRHRDDTYYSLGSFAGCVTQSGDTVGCDPYVTLKADTWNYSDTPDYDEMLIKVDLSKILTQSGVYTVVIYAEPNNSSGDYSEDWPVMSYSIFWK